MRCLLMRAVLYRVHELDVVGPTMVQVVAWPVLEPVLGPGGNLSFLLINTVTTGVVLHLYGPLFWQVSPVLPLAVTAVCVVCASIIVISP
jgi:hypothetical protein